MSERERWIVYPLLFFALGAAIRDKILNSVESDQIACEELDAKTIRCEEIVVTDPQGRTAGLAKLGSTALQPNNPDSKRVGLLVLTDTEGTEFFGLADDELFMRRLRCENLAIMDPQTPGGVVAALGVGEVTLNTNPPQTRRVGVFRLNNQVTAQLPGVPAVGASPASPIPAATQPPAAAPTPQEAQAPQEAPTEPTPASQSPPPTPAAPQPR
ncbi:MAG: hypothetical protein KDA44_10225 [Planctomycetales bacterium]|nr:hypothetical protein [Planctomycetales bacterium]